LKPSAKAADPMPIPIVNATATTRITFTNVSSSVVGAAPAGEAGPKEAKHMMKSMRFAASSL
jgi:hypothetical protein